MAITDRYELPITTDSPVPADPDPPPLPAP